jgi:plasmid stability protein
MSSLLIKNMPETLREKLKQQAELNHRSMNKQVVSILEQALMKPGIGPLPPPVKTRTRLTAAWVSKAIKQSRK